MAGLSYGYNYVAGPCTYMVRGFNANGTPSGSWLPLGLDEDGAQINITPFNQPIRTSAGGPLMAADVQDMGIEADIDIKLITWIDSSLQFALDRQNAVNDGVQGLMGTPLFASASMFSLLIQPSPAELDNYDDPYQFYCCYVARNSTKRNTVANPYNFSVKAILPLGTQLSATGLKLYGRTNV